MFKFPVLVNICAGILCAPLNLLLTILHSPLWFRKWVSECQSPILCIFQMGLTNGIIRKSKWRGYLSAIASCWVIGGQWLLSVSTASFGLNSC